MSGNGNRREEIIEPAGFQPLESSRQKSEDPSSLPRRLLVGFALSAFAAVLFFLFSARSVHIDVVADSSPNIRVSGFAIPLGERYLM